VLAHDGLQRLGLLDAIVVGNGSTDASAAVAQAVGARIIRPLCEDCGAACLAGVLAAMPSDIVLCLDADRSNEPVSAASAVGLACSG
jgi:glycosyltransferase involved in cell wall biosynthesis